MADLTSFNFAPENTESVTSFSILPPNIYTVAIVGTDVKETQKRDGQYLEIKYQITSGKYTGDTILDRLNLRNPSEQAQRIGLSQLKDVCEAVGFKGQLRDSEQLHGKTLSIDVRVTEFRSNKTGKMLKSNEIKKRMPKQVESAVPDEAAAEPETEEAMGW